MSVLRYGICHRTTGSWLSLDGRPMPVADETTREFTTWERADDYRKRALGSFAGAWKPAPLPEKPRPGKALPETPEQGAA